MANLNITSWNVKGLGHPVKLRTVLTHLKKYKTSIALLQETHMTSTEHLKLKHGWVGQVFSSSFRSNSRGVAILIDRQTPFVFENQILDSEGRYILITGSLFGQHMTLLNVYAPNEDCPEFMAEMITLFNHHCKGVGLIAGDLNLIMNPSIDKAPPALVRSKSSVALNGLCEEIGLIDVWRELNPNSKNYTFFSNPHKSFSRLDYFLIPSSIVHLVSKCDIGQIIISDHAPIFLDIKLTPPKPQFKSWKFNTSLLADTEFDTYFKKIILDFYNDNKHSGVNAAMVWDAAKATFRGYIISYASFKKKESQKARTLLENQVKHLDVIHKYNPSDENRKAFSTAKAKLELDYVNDTKKLLLFSRQKHYEFSNRIGKLLSYQLKKEDTERQIKAIRTQNQVITYDPVEINNAFFTFFNNLYQAHISPTSENIDSFLHSAHLPKATAEDCSLLNKPFSSEEVYDTIKSMSVGKCPGLDGFPVELYLHFWSELKPLFMPMVVEFGDGNNIPGSMKEAAISLIKKKDKDMYECSTYRPISLLNTDYKILAKLLAKRLNPVLPSLIKNDQTGFVKGRYGADNIRRLINLIDYANKNGGESAIVSLDGDKAFDRVDWSFLFSSLEHFGLGPRFINCIKALYTSPTAQVITNGILSPKIELARGTRQGCPLSGSLYALVAESFAQLVRLNSTIKGISVGNLEHKISLYADDTLIYISNLDQSIPNLLSLINLYGSISGYKINLSKSILCPLTHIDDERLNTISPFKHTKEGFTYLGVFISPVLDNLFKCNYTPLVQKIKEDIDLWTNLPLTLIGQINVVKMNLLPRLNYLFQSLPCPIPSTFFKNLNTEISKFLWNHKKVRISLATLCKPCKEGGLALPNFELYYWSAQIKRMAEWFQDSEDFLWKSIEAHFSYPTPLKSLPFINKNVAGLSKSFIIDTVLSVWPTCKKYCKLPKNISVLSPISHNPDIPATLSEIGLHRWTANGVNNLGCLFMNTDFKSFEEMKDEYGLSPTSFFQYIQLRHFLQSLIQKNIFRFKADEIEMFLCTQSMTKITSKIYKNLNCRVTSSFTPLKRIWETDLNLSIDQETWSMICAKVNTSSISPRVLEHNYKFIFKTFLTPVCLSKMSQENSPLCNKCKSTLGTYSHMFWFCTKIKPFWQTIHSLIEKMLKLKFRKSPLLYLLGVDLNVTMNSPHRRLFDLLRFLAKKCILTLWKTENIPTEHMWMAQIMSLIPLERLKYEMQDKAEVFLEVWSPVLYLLEGN